MPKMDIYQVGSKIASEHFEKGFYVIENEDGIFWEIDEKRNKRVPKKGGAIVVWIVVGESTLPSEIIFINSGWKFRLDGVIQNEKHHEGIYVSGKTVELEYENYRFVCAFPPAK